MNGNTVNKKSSVKRWFGFNKFTVIFLFIYFLLGVGGTYAFYAFRVQEESVIAGNIISIDADLKVELVVGSNTKMVPMNGDALSNAINGVGSDNGACVDSVGNLSCQVYKITLTNNGSRLRHVVGTVELYAKDGEGNVYNNLKWRELSDTTTVKEDSRVNGMEKSVLVSDLVIESKEEKIWYIAVWINEANTDQRETDKGLFGGTVTFETTEPASNVFTETILEPNAQSDEDIDFGVTSSTSGTNGIYLRSGTENNTNPIYYYRGNVDNNLIFADTCWKVVRTTETGGLKLLYNGVPSNGQCNNTGDASQIGTKAFNTNCNSPSYSGYMYSNPYLADNKYMSSVTDVYYYGNDVTYSNGKYTLTNTISSADWSSLYDEGLKNNHYTCFSTSTTCENVYYIYQTNASHAYYLELIGGVNIGQALTNMLGADDSNIINYNKISSTIKGNNTTEGTLDYWYYNNIERKGYSSYVEDTIWCNDRSISQLGGFNPDGGLTNENGENDGLGSYLFFSEYESVLDYFMGTTTTLSSSLTCNRNIDKFTVSESNGNGNLDYPVGLLTISETLLAGGSLDTNDSYYLYTGENFWGGSPLAFSYGIANVSGVWDDGSVAGGGGGIEFGVRPSVSLKSGFNLTGDGDGSVTNPYVVE